MMAMLTVAGPLLAGLRGAPLPVLQQVLSGADFEPLPGRSRLVPYRNESGRARPSTHQRSGMLRGLALAHGVMVVPPEGCRTDQPVQALELPWLTQH
jgi:molybdopterin molybdotransferase